MKLLFQVGFIFLLLFQFACKPISKFIVQKSEKSLAPVKIEFSNLSKRADTFEWDFDDGSQSKETNPNHIYSESGNYTVKLKAKKGNHETVSTQKVVIGSPQVCTVQIETKFGIIVVELFDDTPLHRDNFIKLIEKKYYDGLLFHRVINGFMIQGGDPRSRGARPTDDLGSGGPDYTVPQEITNNHPHFFGALAAARKGDLVNPSKASSGSQFYFVHGRKVTEKSLNSLSEKSGWDYSPEQRAQYLKSGGTPFLDGNYTVFGQVISGFDVLNKIAEVETSETDRPKEDIKMVIKAVN